ncbi:hypothetical protein APA_1945 [Pseudanabaena sp. lw0831]|nr:hypothetical protein APA_1945 [Pseudanabaena sp. lw0831]
MWLKRLEIIPAIKQGNYCDRCEGKSITLVFFHISSLKSQKTQKRKKRR